MDRRIFLGTAGTATAVLLAGCLGGGDDEEPMTDGGTDLPTATLHTSKGDVEIELYEERAPRTVENFVGLATGERVWEDPETGEEVDGKPLYDDVLFHRVIDDFMVQTGDPTGTGRGGPGYEFDDEFHDELRHDGEGVVSMANRGPDTNGSQFFITLEATPHLDDSHSVFEGRRRNGRGARDRQGRNRRQ